MSVNLVHARRIFLPKVPPEIEDAKLKDYLQRLTDAIENMNAALVDNDGVAVSSINTGTSGTFDDSAGGTVTVADGLITGLA